jgi:glycosyltransferase involved in cell wall biosynthesis
MTKFYWHSTAPWSASSYSILTARTVPSIFRVGYEIVVGAWYGLQGRPLPWGILDKDGSKVGDVWVLPNAGNHAYGADTIEASYAHHKADALITCSDVWIFPPIVTSKTNFCPWLPIDHDPAPEGIVKALDNALYPMVMSKWGVDILAAAGVKSHFVPCSAPADVFKPGDKAAARAKLAMPAGCDFLVTMVAANKDGMDRKAFGEALQGFAKFAESHPGAFLYCHTNWAGPVNIGKIAESLGIRDKIIMCDQYAYNFGLLDDAYMVNVYQASDVLLNPCKSEGFGLPIVEAQMCGVPVAATDFATTDELLFAGWKLAGQRDWSPGADSWRLTVYVSEIVAALEMAYADRGNEKLAKKARNGAMRFDNGTVFNQYWKPALKEIERRVEAGKVVSVNGHGKPRPAGHSQASQAQPVLEAVPA